jgi:Asp-tRNA(Asn)/Glu-tRNA(Gln) amidotransferase A subunit family amidase
MAKTNMHELAFGITSTNSAYGFMKNPYNKAMIPGGSSGGTAVGIAARMSSAGLGSDTGGSVRIPPALCGIVGLRPSVGNGNKRYPDRGVVPISHTRDTVGPMARTVAAAKTMPKEAYDAAIMTGRPQLQKLYADYFKENDVDAVIFPTTPLPARPINPDGDTGKDTVELNGKEVPTFPTYIRNTDPGSNAGIPGLSLPAGLTKSNLPVGLELDGPVGSDQRLLAIGVAMEAAFGVLPPPNI